MRSAMPRASTGCWSRAASSRTKRSRLPAPFTGVVAPLANVEMVKTPKAGAVLYDVRPGDRVKEGDRLATIVHAPGEADGALEIFAPQSGYVLTRRSTRALQGRRRRPEAGRRPAERGRQSRARWKSRIASLSGTADRGGWLFSRAISASSSAMRLSRDGERCGDVGGLEALRDVLLAVRIPGRDREQDHLLAARLVAFRHQPVQQLGIVLDDRRLAPDLDAPAVRIVDQEQMRLRIVGEVAAA